MLAQMRTRENHTEDEWIQLSLHYTWQIVPHHTLRVTWNLFGTCAQATHAVNTLHDGLLVVLCGSAEQWRSQCAHVTSIDYCMICLYLVSVSIDTLGTRVRVSCHKRRLCFVCFP